MIRTSRQLKALVRNKSKGDNAKALTIIRNYIMERFLERLSLSPYRKNLILKGGMLISAMIGRDSRSTMDIDAAIKALPLSEETAERIVTEIASIEIDDGMTFSIKSVLPIMDEADYPGIRVMLDTTLETMRTPLKIDFSTGDVITPGEISYSFRLLFEEREISIMAYNLETLLAEKTETVLSRGTVNTRMRDFYDIYVLEYTQFQNIDRDVLRAAFSNTCENRSSSAIGGDMELVLDEIESSRDMAGLWRNYQQKFDYAAGIGWKDMMQAVRRLCVVVQ